MKIVRAPLRISLGGGGTDLPSWYSQYGGFLISAAINKYIYLTGCERPFDKKFWLSYSKVEVVDSPDQIRHELLNRCLLKYELPKGIEIHSISEVPGSSGLGSSGAFTVGALTLLNALKKIEMGRKELAELACSVEMIDLKGASGKQDQYISAFGGVASMDFDKSGNVDIRSMDLDLTTIKRLENNLLIYFTGVSRDANPILAEQGEAFKNRDEDKIAVMKQIQDIGFRSRDALVSGDIDQLGPLMHEHWLAKKRISDKMSNLKIDELYELARKNGATGGKVMGAGGGGYWMFYVPPESQFNFRRAMTANQLVEMDWRFDHTGCSVVYSA